MISPQGRVLIVETDMVPFDIKADFYAEGIGRELAMGALAMGATAEEAARVAIKYSTGCGGKVQKVVL